MDERGIVIKQEELAELAEHQQQIAWRTKRLEQLRANLKPLLEAQVPIEPGRYDAFLKRRIGRGVPWRQLFIERLGSEAAMLAKKLFKTHVYFEVVVEEHAVPPLWRGLEGSGAVQP